MRILKYGDPTTTLRGQIYTDYFFGRPNYGESPERDQLEHSILLALDEPFSIPARESEREGDYEAAAADDIQLVQLAGVFDIEYLRCIRGHGVEVTGALFAAHTGHHHTKVLISVRDKETVVVDARNTFPGAHVARGGTGFLLGCDGLIVTAAHVVAGTLGITVTRGLLRAKATLEYHDPVSDLAILKLESDDTMGKVIEQREGLVRPIRTWMPPQLGERVYAFGFPLRSVLPHTLNMSEGMVSAEMASRPERFQISAPIQKGNSGGPVYDQHANLIGVVTAKLPAIRGDVPEKDILPENVNFAIRTQHLVEICRRNFGCALPREEGRVSGPPVVLGKLMQQLCVEVECWESDGK
jgi:hypothetical protein